MPHPKARGCSSASLPYSMDGRKKEEDILRALKSMCKGGINQTQTHTLSPEV